MTPLLIGPQQSCSPMFLGTTKNIWVKRCRKIFLDVYSNKLLCSVTYFELFIFHKYLELHILRSKALFSSSLMETGNWIPNINKAQSHWLVLFLLYVYNRHYLKITATISLRHFIREVQHLMRYILILPLLPHLSWVFFFISLFCSCIQGFASSSIVSGFLRKIAWKLTLIWINMW